MNEITTTVVMVSIFCIIGVALPVFLMIRDENKNPQSSLPNKLILWITMVFCMMLVFGIIVDFQSLSEKIRADVIQYGFIALMLFGAMFGIDQLLKSKYIKTVKWKDLTVETLSGQSPMHSPLASSGSNQNEQGAVQNGAQAESEPDNQADGDDEHENN